MDDIEVTPAENTQQVETIGVEPDKPKRTVSDWIRDMRMSASVNKTTVGVATDRVTPELMLATSRKLLGISRREAEADPKDSLEFQRFYGPAEYFSEHILRDSGKLGRNLLWKATNRGNLDWVQTNTLDNHVSDVFYNSKLAQMVDGSSPLELMDSSMKVTRIGEGGVGDIDSAPVEMRLVQPSFYGFVDPVRSPESLRVGLDAYLAKNIMKGSDGKLYRRMVNAHTGKEELVDSVTAARSVVTTPDMMEAKTQSIYALGGKTGVRIVNKKDVDYYMPRSDEMFSTAANMVPMLNGVKEMRLLMGCLHPMTSVLYTDASGLTHMKPANSLDGRKCRLPGSDARGNAAEYSIRTTVAKFTPSRSWFRKVTLLSGRTLITSNDHRWGVIRNGKYQLVQAARLKAGDHVMRSDFSTVPMRKTFLFGSYVNDDVAYLLGCAAHSIKRMEHGRLRLTITGCNEEVLRRAVDKLQLEACSFYSTVGMRYLSIEDTRFQTWATVRLGISSEERRVPTEILSAGAGQIAAFLAGYTEDKTRVGVDEQEDYWVLHIENVMMRDALAYLWLRLGTDSLYRDALTDTSTELALHLMPLEKDRRDTIIDVVKCVKEGPAERLMIDIDVDDNLYAVANGVITHNSKYAMQAIPLEQREAPLVRTIDEATDKDMPSIIGKYLGAQYARQGGTVTAVRKDRIDVTYDDGSKGAISLYNNFPMNAKGFITNTPSVKAGQTFKQGDLLASSNYTDDKGVAAIGKPLRSAWISWKGGTYEDGLVISESCAKKMASTTMYPTAIDLDKTVSLGKQNYQLWKPSEYTAEQMENLDKDGIVKPGSILRPGDPMILAVRTTEPSPGTLGKRILTDLSETWGHDHTGIVTDVVKSRKRVKVYATVTAPCEVGDKLSNSFGAKGVISKILPDDEMPQDKDGNPMDILFSPLGLITRCNPSQLHEALLGKIAHKTGKPETMPAFYKGDAFKYVEDRLKQNHLQSNDDLVDPTTGKTLQGILNGYSYIYKLKHLSESKMSGRGTGAYTSEGTPALGSEGEAKRYGGLEQSALVGHNAFEVLKDAHYIRGQSNADFWRSIRTGEIPVMPGEPKVHKKFFAHLQGSGVNIRKTAKGVSVFAMTNSDVNQLAGPRELKSRDTYEVKNFRPIDGGLFGQDVFGVNGDQWGYIQLDKPLPNPVMEQPLSRLLNISEKDFQAVVAGEKEVDGMKSASDIKERLASINLEAASEQAKNELKNSTRSKKDAALKRYVAIERMRRQGVSPDEYMLDRIPVLPPDYRPVSTHSGLTMVADSNYLYAQLLDARNDMREAKDLPREYQQQAEANIYRKWKELAGLYDPENPKLQHKNVKGLLAWAIGGSGTSPKFSSIQRRVIGNAVDTVGRGVIISDSRLKLNEIGMPAKMAMSVYAPFITRKLVKQGYTAVDAMKMVKAEDKKAVEALQSVMEDHPVQMNRAPTLHKLSIMGFNAKLVPGHAIHINPSVCPGFAADFDGDTVNLHVPVSDSARKETYARMFPERNLISMRNRKIMYKPEKEYIQGLYVATRMKDGKQPQVFKTVEDARAALRAGALDVDDPIIIGNR